MLVRHHNKVFWYLKTKGERLAGAAFLLPPSVGMISWGGAMMNEQHELLLMHIIGWIGLIGYFRRFLVVDGVELKKNELLLWKGPAIAGFFWRSEQRSMVNKNLKWKSIQQKETHQKKHRIQLSGKSNNKQSNWVFSYAFANRQATRALLQELRLFCQNKEQPE